MPVRHLFLPGYELGESQNDMLVQSPRYTSPTTSSDVLHTYPKLTVIVAYFPGRPEKQGFVYTRGRLRGEE